MKNKSKTVYTNLMWRLLERFGAQGVTLVVSLIFSKVIRPRSIWNSCINNNFYSSFECFCGQWVSEFINTKEKCR